jgi:hypothetical protein
MSKSLTCPELLERIEEIRALRARVGAAELTFINSARSNLPPVVVAAQVLPAMETPKRKMPGLGERRS